MKPVDMIGRAIRNSSRVGTVVLDPFGGAGSTPDQLREPGSSGPNDPSGSHGGYKNCRWWTSCTPNDRLCYLIGLADGLVSADFNANLAAQESGHPPLKPNNMAGSLFPGGILRRVRKGLDQFYEDPANVAIAIQDALTLYVQKVRGATPEQTAAHTASTPKAPNETLEKAATEK